MNKIKKLTLTLFITSILLIIAIPSSFASTGTITVDTLRVRKAPSISSDVVRNFDKGDKVEVIEKKDEWYKIKLTDGKEAYVYAEYVKLEENNTTNEETKQETQKEENKTKTEIELNSNTRIHILPSLFSSEISKTTEKVKVTVVEAVNNWICVEYNGTTGWVLNKEGRGTAATINVPEAPATDGIGYINVSSAFLRKEASKTAEILDSLYLDNEVKILKKVDEWYQIQLGDKIGYIFAELISDKKIGTSSRSLVTSRTATGTERSEVTKSTENKAISTGYISVSVLNVRTGASSSSSILTTLKQKTKVEILEETNGWYKIITSLGEGYISKQYIVDSLDKIVVKKVTTNNTQKSSATGAATASANNVVDFAKNYVGYKYVYGGSGPTSFDCSGFTMYVYKNFGVSLPHNAVTQARYGKHVSRENLQPGDLLIFNNSGNTSIGHAGIYIGNGKFVHAANSKTGVTISTIDSGYYKIRFVEGRRLV